METITSFQHSVHDEPNDDWTIEELLQWCHLQSKFKIDQKTNDLVDALQQCYNHAERDMWELHTMAVEANRDDDDDEEHDNDNDNEDNESHAMTAESSDQNDHESISTLTSASVSASIRSMTPMQQQLQQQQQQNEENIPPNVNANVGGERVHIKSASASGGAGTGAGTGTGTDDANSNATQKATKAKASVSSKATTTATTTTTTKRRKHNNLHVEILTGPHKGETYLLKPRANRSCEIGRSKGKKFRERGISLHLDSEVSTCHGKFEIKVASTSTSTSGGKAGGGGSKICYTDTGSTNGTSYMGEALEDYVPLELEDGMVLCFGESELRFTIVEA